MKFLSVAFAAFALAAFPVWGDQVKANNNTNLESGASWVSGVAPGSADDAIWDSTVTTPSNSANTLGATAAWKGIVIKNPAAAVAILGNTTLSNGSAGIDLSAATVSLTIDCGTLDVFANQNWNIPAGLSLTTGSSSSAGSVSSPENGNFIVTKLGSGVWNSMGNGDNGSLGIIIDAGTVNLGKTSSSGAHAVGGPGLVIKSGAVARITGSGGDQIYDGATLTLSSGALFDLNGHSESIGSISGAGGNIDNTAANSTSVITFGNTIGNGGGSFGGSIQNSAAGATLSVVKQGSGLLSLTGSNSYIGGTTVSAGTLALTTTNNVSMPYTINGGVLQVTAASPTNSLPASALALTSSSSQLTFNLGSVRNVAAPLIHDTGNLTINQNIAVNVQNISQSGTYTLLQYNGARSGSGSFISGSLPAGANITDDTTNGQLLLTYASLEEPRIVIPTLNTNEAVVAIATPQQYGAKGDGISDDSAAFQNAMNAVYNSGGSGGGVVFVPAGNYAFYHNLTIPTGVTLHGDWTDWTKTSGGMVGTTFKVYFGAGETNASPFITLEASTALRDVNIWYPNQNASNIVAYPFTIGVGSACVAQNIVLLNSYQGIESYNGGDESILSTIVGSPLYKGIAMDQIFDVCHSEDIRFSPAIWPLALVTNSPASASGPHADWMRTHGEGMRLLRVDGDMCWDTWISGYSVGIEANAATNGQPGVTFYSGAVSNCATAFLAQDMPSAFGPMFANFTLDGDIAVNRTNGADDANAMFDHCVIIGRNGTAVSSTGADWHSWMQFQNCTISNTLDLAGPGVCNIVDSTLQGATQAILSSSATRVAFTGCSFVSPTNIVNHGATANLLIDPRTSISNAFPIVFWTNIMSDFASRRAARTNLYVATDAPYGAYGDGSHDDTAAVQSALTTAGNGGGGVVYLPAGKYRLTDTLDVPNGVELHGAYELRHRTWPGNDGNAKGTVLEPYGGQGTTNGPPAVALEANAGLVGVTISYETQDTNCIAFPPAIQGRGSNVYVIGVCCPNPYYYVDLDTYACPNHFLDMVDGWALKLGYKVGHGSSGTILDCHCNWTYWIDNLDSASSLPQNIQAPVLSFTSHQLQMYQLGQCSELMAKDFSIIEDNFMHCVDENGHGPNVTLINTYCDATIQGYVLDAADPASSLTAVNTPMTTFNFGGYSDQAESTVAVLSTTNFQGFARYFSSVLWGGTYLDFVVNGGDVGFDMAHMDSHSFIGSICNGGVFHLINNSAYSASGGPSNFPPYSVAFGPNSGEPGKTSEFIGCFAYNGCNAVNPSPSNTLAAWNDYALSSYSVYNPTLPVLYGFSPDGSALFQFTDDLNFSVASPLGMETSNVVVTINGVVVTNLTFTGASSGWDVAYQNLAVNTAYSVVVTVTDNSGNVVSATVLFDTFNPDNYTFEAEDFNYGGGQFIDNPQTNAYAGLQSVDEVDCHNASGGSDAYRPNPNGLATEDAGDIPRPAYAGGLQDYDVGFNNGGNWGNYTRHFPAGIYNLYMRAASPNGSPSTADAANLSLVTGSTLTSNQTAKVLGTFTIPNTGDWHVFSWVPLQDSKGNFIRLTNDGTAQTYRITTVNGGYNANFYELAPVSISPGAVTLSAATSDGNLWISFIAQTGFSCQLQSTADLTNPAWTNIGQPITGNGAVQSTLATPITSAFYRMAITQIRSN